MAKKTLHHVSQWQIRNVALACEVLDVGLIAHRLADGLKRPRNVSVAQHDAFRRSGRAGGVNNGSDIIESGSLCLHCEVDRLERHQVAELQYVVGSPVRCLDKRNVFDRQKIFAH